jgi:hypothetical protein
MARPRDLFWQAAAKATPPVRRLYFDTEPLRHGDWPFMSNQFKFCLRLADAMNVELYIPQPALYERAEQGIREALAEVGAAEEKAKTAGKALRRFGAAVEFRAPAEAELRASYEQVQQAALREFHIRQASHTSRELDDVFRMAVARDFTFEHTKHGVVGLQDCVILLSVFDHLRANPTSAALVSNDAVFSRIPKLVPPGVELRHILGLTALSEVLDKATHAAFGIEFEQWWAKETDRLKQALETHRDKIKEFLEETIDPTELGKVFGFGNILAIQQLTIKGFDGIRPGLEGGTDERQVFSCDASVSYTATIERSVSLASLLGQQPLAESPPPILANEHRTITIELTAKISRDYADLTLETARIRD